MSKTKTKCCPEFLASTARLMLAHHEEYPHSGIGRKTPILLPAAGGAASPQ
jgi:hypothetical protein